ncbi:phage neck terminator protein [Megamonas funiformis]|jgi:hypothetical protein|uniref:phage neck terminator protein n=1 Tax=Megamonas funiformis TaxID=437897 RepID=UPI0035204E57
MNDEQNLLFHDLVAELLDLQKNKVIYAYQNAPKPKDTFAYIRYASIKDEVQSSFERTNKPGVNNIIGHKLLTCEIQVFADNNRNACTMLYKLIDKLNKQSVINRLFKANIAIVDYNSVQDVSALLNNTHFTTRASVDIIIRFTPTYLDDVGYIANVKITGNTGKELPIEIITEEI